MNAGDDCRDASRLSSRNSHRPLLRSCTVSGQPSLSGPGRMRANAGFAEDQHIVQELDALDAVHLGFGLPGELANIPVRLGNVLIGPAPAGLQYSNICFSRSAADISSWPQADIKMAPRNVCLRQKSGHRSTLAHQTRFYDCTPVGFSDAAGRRLPAEVTQPQHCGRLATRDNAESTCRMVRGGSGSPVAATLHVMPNPKKPAPMMALQCGRPRRREAAAFHSGRHSRRPQARTCGSLIELFW